MSINIEKVDLLMERANIGYKEAYELLQQHNGSVIEALVYLENCQKTKTEKHQERYQPTPNVLDNIQDFIVETHEKRFTVSNEDRKVVDLPLTVAGIAGIIALPVAVPLLAIGLFTGHKIKITNTVVSNTELEPKTCAPSQQQSETTNEVNNQQ